MGERTGSIGSGAAGGLLAGIGLSAVLVGMERTRREPSELVGIGRRAATLLGSPYLHGNSMPDRGEQVRYHGAHLLLSAAIGAVVPLLRSRRLGGTPGAGLIAGLGTYALCHGVAGPGLGLVPGPTGESRGITAGRIGLHAGFGLAAAGLGRLLSPNRGRAA